MRGTLLVGTDPIEWWHGRETRVMWGHQLEKIGGSFPVTAEEIEAWEEGTVGWATAKETIDWAGASLEPRATYVLHLEQGEGRSCTSTGQCQSGTWMRMDEN